MGRRMRKDLEKILDRDYRFSIKYWTENLVLVRESLRTNTLPDGTVITEEDRPQIEDIETFIEENLHRIRSVIVRLEEKGDEFVKAILGYISELPDDLDKRIPKKFMRDMSTKAGEVVKIKNIEEREREKWK